ncbi:PQQ-binding-like beta-propeller repeat protein [Nitrincola alkalilacustris]|uniref:PQQ-binding-like beta-propeller repeat protein n=1 Tax=Nitrincola alkalilacustris TaxID=1571224 RepID=UPI001456366E|nr:PQQ-binding-like beta-propeller repeat protein [Nitrincola alkalilacustris]
MNRSNFKYILIWLFILSVLSAIFLYIKDSHRQSEIWSFKTLSLSTSRMLLHDNNIYFTDQANHVYSLSTDGDLNWKLDLGCPITTLKKIIIYEKYIAAITAASYQTLYPETVTSCQNEERLHIIDRNKGKLINIKGGDLIYSNGFFNGKVYYSTSSGLYKSEITGTEEEIIIDSDIEGDMTRSLSSHFSFHDSMLYMKNMDQHVFAFDLISDEIKWQHASDWQPDQKDSVEPTRTSRSLVYDEGVIYTVNKVQHSTAADVYAFDAESGVILGRYRIEAGASPGRLSASDKYIYIPSRDSRVHALTKRDLYPVWDVPTIGPVRGAMVPYQGVVYAGTQAGSIIGLDEETGERVYRYPTDDPIPGTPAIQDGIIYFATNGGSIHAVRLPDK